LANGIDVFLQTSYGTQTKRHKDIKTSHLAELVSLSHSDFFVVIGDKNMKQMSCQAKRKGKLVEMKVEEVISLIWNSWPQNIQKVAFKIAGLNSLQIETLLKQYCGYVYTKSLDQFQSVYDAPVFNPDELEKCTILLIDELNRMILTIRAIPIQDKPPKETPGEHRDAEYKPNDPGTPLNRITEELKKFLLRHLLITLRSTVEQLHNHKLFGSRLYQGRVKDAYDFLQIEENQKLMEDVSQEIETEKQPLIDVQSSKELNSIGQRFDHLHFFPPRVPREYIPSTSSSSFFSPVVGDPIRGKEIKPEPAPIRREYSSPFFFNSNPETLLAYPGLNFRDPTFLLISELWEDEKMNSPHS
jgi:hypothetical protein